MGLPITKIDFVAKAEDTSRLLQRGVVAMLLKANSTNVYTFKSYEEAKSKLATDKISLQADGEKALEMIFRGATNRPYRVHIAFCNVEEKIVESLQVFEGIKFDWICCPEFSAKNAEISKWVKDLNNDRNLEVKAVLSGEGFDSEYIVNFVGNKIVMDKLGNKSNVEVSAALFTARVASALCGTPLTRAITNLELQDVASVERLTNAKYDELIEAGKLVIYNDWDKVRFGRGVNSLTNLNGKTEDRKKILIIAKMHMWKREIKELINEKYLGAMQNGINEKMLLITSIKQYNAELVKMGVILASTSESDVDIDVVAQENYLKTIKNIDTSNMSEKDIRHANTGSNVFLKADLSFTDAMEDIQVTVSC
ncbi:phage tail sheath subtilisin-like domain-containing protein [Peptostreptococcus sp. D1]|uniref:phage tail sheath subtilisin-like domain-containing protein n=1 Tax=Peptostreptococcus sp. D1 TaxID=72304 RepID=UPI0008F36A30|nr:phage tail sheath subtilisin-like domain-containing protein [Peptostreptococcus sp. D1]SFE87871.1 Phage tail sheath protein [Peptostreptococcus sp. D1]